MRFIDAPEVIEQPAQLEADRFVLRGQLDRGSQRAFGLRVLAKVAQRSPEVQASFC